MGPRPLVSLTDVGEVDLACHTHVPAVSVPSHAPSDDHSNCTGHAAAVSSQRSSVTWFGHQMCHVSLVPLTWCGLPPGLVGSQILDESQIRWSSAGSGTEARHAQSPTKIVENCPSCSISGSYSRRQASVECESLPESCSLVSDANGGRLSEKFHEVQESQKAGTSVCASPRPARWQRGGQRYQCRKRARSGSFWTTTPPSPHSGESPVVSRKESLLKRRDVRASQLDEVVKQLLAGSSNL